MRLSYTCSQKLQTPLLSPADNAALLLFLPDTRLALSSAPKTDSLSSKEESLLCVHSNIHRRGRFSSNYFVFFYPYRQISYLAVQAKSMQNSRTCHAICNMGYTALNANQGRSGPGRLEQLLSSLFSGGCSLRNGARFRIRRVRQTAFSAAFSAHLAT